MSGPFKMKGSGHYGHGNQKRKDGMPYAQYAQMAGAALGAMSKKGDDEGSKEPVGLDKEHYAVVFTDWEGDASNGQALDEGEYQWPSVCPVCPRKCIHGAPSKWVRMEIPGDGDISISGIAHIDEVAEWDDGSWTITGTGEGTFYNPFVQANMSGKIEFTDLEVSTDAAESPYYDYGGRYECME